MLPLYPLFSTSSYRCQSKFKSISDRQVNQTSSIDRIHLRGMWALVLTASLLIRAIVGNLDIESSNSKRVSRFEIGGRANPELQSSYGEGDASRAWEDKEPIANKQNETELSPIESKRQKVSNTRTKLNELMRSRVGQISKRSETVPDTSWLYAAIKKKIPSSEEWMQEKRNPWIGKRVTLYRMGSGIRRPIRMPFNSWGGKRSSDVLNLNGGSREKKSKDVLDRDEQRVLLEGYGVKRVAEASKARWKVPFNSWGGKRSQNDFNQRNLLVIVDKETDPRTERIGEFTENQGTENSLEEKRAGQLKDSQGRMRFHSWGGKRNELDYQVLSSMNNETGTDYRDHDEIDDWSITTADKRAERALFSRTGFNPWGGKRSQAMHEYDFADDYSGIPAESPKGRKVFFPWGG